MDEPGAAAALEIPLPELVLMATGLLAEPTRTHLKAAKTYQKELTKALKAALALEDPGHLYALKSGDAYWKKLQATAFDYEALSERFEALLGLDVSAQYQALQMGGKAELEARHPVTTISTVLGDRILPSDPLSDGQFAVLADTVEDHMRLVHDFAAGVLVSPQVQVYATVFPDAYSYLVQIMEMELVRLQGPREKGADWLPPLWLSDTIKVMRQQPLETTVDTKQQKDPASPTGKLKLDDQIEDLETTADRSSAA